MTVKACIKCLRELPLSAFYFRKDSGKYRTQCKECWCKKTKEWSDANNDKRRTIALAWVNRNREEFKRKQRKRRRERPEEARKWERNNVVKMREYRAAWAKRNPGKQLANLKARMARKLQAMPTWVDRKALSSIYIKARATGKHVDHIVPLRHPLVCGLHVPWNLQLLEPHENFTKSNKFDPVAACQ